MAPVTAFFAALLAFIYLGLSVHVIIRRYSLKLALGDGDDEAIRRRIRSHGNFAEYVPFILLLMLLNELNGASRGFLTLMGAMLVMGRILHAYSVSHNEMRRSGKIIFRQIGMGTTFTVMIALSLAAIF